VKSVQSWPAGSPSAVYCKFFTQTRVRTEVIFSLVVVVVVVVRIDQSTVYFESDMD
jgi:hypothetical protein